jgi:hypothetical protein
VIDGRQERPGEILAAIGAPQVTTELILLHLPLDLQAQQSSTMAAAVPSNNQQHY